jgi:hypothetical protein
MQAGPRTLTWAYAFFWCAALSVVLGFWGLVRSTTIPIAGLAPRAVFAVATLAIYVGAALRTVRRLPTMSLAAARSSVLMLAGIGLLLASMLLNLR